MLTWEKSMHVVFGAAGALGAAIVQNLAQQNKAVRAVVRDVGKARKVLPSSAEIVVADASKPESIKPAFHNVSVIYHCVNVPYDKWTEVMPLVTDNILAGAIERQASVVFPGNVYVYGRFQRIPATEDHPLGATGKKGKLRIALVLRNQSSYIQSALNTRNSEFVLTIYILELDSHVVCSKNRGTSAHLKARSGYGVKIFTCQF